MTGREVWITGVGAVSAAGLGAPALLDLLLAGRTGLGPAEGLGGMLVGAAPELPPTRAGRRLDRSARMWVAAALEAWHGAGLDQTSVDPRRIAVIEGSSLGPLAELLETHRERVEHPTSRPPGPSGLVRFMTGAGGAAIAQALGVRGPVLHLSAGSVSAACAIGEASRWIAAGLADVVVAGGAECPLQKDVIELFRGAGLLAGPDLLPAPCRPFDARRDGTALGEGAGALVLEAADHARRRGAVARGVLRGFALACESYSMTAPDPEGTGVSDAVGQALDGVPLGDIGWIKAHGTGTTLSDAAECRGLARVFGVDLASRPLTALKPALGHCLGASGALETVAAVLSLERGVIPPTLGTERVDVSLPPITVMTGVEESPATHALLLAESFGGRCAALVIGRAA